MANGNGQRVTRHAPKGKPFGSPGGPDPAAAARKATIVREAAIQANVNKAREYAAAHILEAVSVFTDALKAASPKEAPIWHVKLKAAKEIVDRFMGQTEQTVTHKQVGEWEERLREWAASLD